MTPIRLRFTCFALQILCSLAYPTAQAAAPATDSTATESAAATSAPARVEVRVQSLPARVALVKPMIGPYSQHGEAFRALGEYASKHYRNLRQAIGIYPQDPDAVGIASVEWSIGVILHEGAGGEEFATPTSPFQLVTLPPTEAAVIDSTMQYSARDGVALLTWLPYSGYAQSGATQTEYFDSTGRPDSRIRISVPIKKRARPMPDFAIAELQTAPAAGTPIPPAQRGNRATH